MIGRLKIYFKEMYPFLSRLFLGYLLFFEIYFLVILTNRHVTFNVGISEIIGGFTIFGFLLFLRIADDFKDYETDLKLFPDRPLSSGRVTKKDLKILLTVDIVLMVIPNLIFMNNVYYFLFLIIYGLLMSKWFFSKAKIQKSLPLALITHNPIQLIINLYIISFTCIKYDIDIISYANLLILFSLYFDGLVWEIGRKIRAPKDEDAYTTYSKLFGYKKPVKFIAMIMFIDLVTSTLMVTELFKYAFIGTIISYIWFTYKCNLFIKDPSQFKMQTVMEKYLYVTEIYVVILIIAYLIMKVFV
jgi:4-hydroxybenzoate polyprenyltransferase